MHFEGVTGGGSLGAHDWGAELERGRQNSFGTSD